MTSWHLQKGVAAIELSLVLGLLLMLFSALLSFSALFLVQQKITHLVGDAARESAIWQHSENTAERYARNSTLLRDYVQRAEQEDAWLSRLAGEIRSTYEENQQGNNRTAHFKVTVALKSWFLGNVLGIFSSNKLDQLQAEATILLKEGRP
ncbi:TadE/TadG family type IV pilus assembly protein [Alcaligenes endophyticus]|uniref:Pilus assembly protein n=1 Tax=Alcaligenes endophyticus TaxID=1929088 RepID=A0ABT8EHD1_9BURK|nr:TadE/TadG family type IV pilus assembly protein [Alcaligenes endophyticus]MCX5592047.1 pilus assembly protein [Alcaligenes endophyticus]MDN4120694.1 pilus assembly protein [Alcaligenes endophyticus]